MDAATDDSDIKLQRVAGDLLDDFGRLMPGFLWKSNAKGDPMGTTDVGTESGVRKKRLRLRVKEKDYSRLILLVSGNFLVIR